MGTAYGPDPVGVPHWAYSVSLPVPSMSTAFAGGAAARLTEGAPGWDAAANVVTVPAVNVSGPIIARYSHPAQSGYASVTTVQSDQ